MLTTRSPGTDSHATSSQGLNISETTQCSWQHVLVFDHPYNKEFFFLTFKQSVLHLWHLLLDLWAPLGICLQLLYYPSSTIYTYWSEPCNSSLFHSKQSHLCQFLQMLQFLKYLDCPSWVLLQYALVAQVLGSPELDPRCLKMSH